MTTADDLAAYKAKVDAAYNRGYSGPPESDRAAALRIRKEEREQDLREPYWLEVNPQGVVDGWHVYDRHKLATEEQVWKLFYPGKRDRDRAIKQGWTIRRDDTEGSGIAEMRKRVLG